MLVVSFSCATVFTGAKILTLNSHYQANHATSNRAQERFVPVDCSGLSESLFELEKNDDLN